MTQQPKAHCYVDLIDPIALEEALQKNGQMLKGNKLIVNRPNVPDGRNRGGRNGARGGSRSYRGGRGNRDSIQPGDI